jgi:hypothetical protein
MGLTKDHTARFKHFLTSQFLKEMEGNIIY